MTPNGRSSSSLYVMDEMQRNGFYQKRASTLLKGVNLPGTDSPRMSRVARLTSDVWREACLAQILCK